MITIHEGTANTFTDNGIAVIEPLSCNFIVNINGSWSLELEMPFDEDQKFKKLQKGNIIKVDDIPVITEQQSNYQLFRIYDDVLTLTSVKVIAFPVAFEATYDAVIEEEYTTGDTAKTLSQVVSGLMTYLSDHSISKYTVSVSNYPSTPTKTCSYENTNLIAVISGSEDTSIINSWNAEAVYDNYDILIKQKIGNQASDYEVRYGKNLTGLSVDTDISGVVTRLYPISKEGIRYNNNNVSYIESDNHASYPYPRSAFINTDFSIVDTNEKSHTNTAKDTRTAKAAIKASIKALAQDFWADIKEGTEFYEPAWVKSVLNDAIADVQNDENFVNPDIAKPLQNVIKAAIKEGLEWIKDANIGADKWHQVSGSWYYGNSDRDIKNAWAYIDKQYSYFDSYGVYQPQMDTKEFFWIQQKGAVNDDKKYGNNNQYFAQNTYVYTMSGDNQEGSSFNQYKFDADGWWDGNSKASDWGWHQDEHQQWWFGKTGATEEKDWAHDCWLYIYDTTQPNASKSLYYFNSDGIMVPSLTTLVNWNWQQAKNGYWFGSTNKEQNAKYIDTQWIKIDGEWYCFTTGNPVDNEITKQVFFTSLKNAIDNAITDIEYYTELLYNTLYGNMYDYCNSLYDKGLCNPNITVTANVVDLSQTDEYAAYTDLLTMHLGDKVKVIDYEHFNAEYYLRVVGLKYDCLRGYNTEVTIGDLSKTVSQMMSSSIGSKQEGNRLVAGDNVTIDGNVINVTSIPGDVYEGTQVEVDPIVTSGTELAKIYIDGVPYSIKGTQTSITPTQLSGNKIADFSINGQNGSLYSPPASGLAYWTETNKTIHKLVTAPLPDNKKWDCDEEWQTTNFQQYYHNDSTSSWINPFTEKGTSQLACGFWTLAQHDTQYGGRVQWMFVLISDKKTATGAYTGRLDGYAPYYSEGTAWENNLYLMQAWSPAYIDVPTAQGNLWLETVSGKYKYLPYYEEFGRYPTAAQALAYFLEISNFRISDTYYSGIGNNDGYVIWGGHTIKENPEITDMPFYVTDDGVIRGAEFEDSEGNPISGGGLSKTELYSASSYASSITLSSAYTGYQFLLIQTYNSDDKEALSAMLNVADLATGQRIGINDYLLYTITNSTTLTFYSSFDDTNHTRRIKGIYGLKTFNGSDVPNIITDVKDGDTSVVSGGVAQIGGKQDKLTAGQNIQIAADGKTISATDTTYNEFAGSAAGLVPSVQTQANKFLRDDGTWATASGGSSSIDTLTDVDLTSLANGQILKYNSSTQKWENANEVSYSDFAGSTHGLVPEVQAQSGKFLKDDGTWDTPASGSASLDGLTDVDLTSPSDGQVLKYDATNQEWINANESGGTTVVANPSGTATDELEKLQVGNDIFSIPSSEVVTQLITRTSQLQWALKKNYSNRKTALGRGSYGGKYFFSFRCDSDSDPTTEDVHLEVACPIAIPPTTRKLRVKFTTTECYDTDPKIVIGLKTTYNSNESSYEYYDDTDWVQRWYDTTENYTYEREFIISTSVPLYFYFIANGWNLTLDSVEIVEVAGGGGDTVVVTPIVTTGTKIATISVNGTSFDLYAPSGGGELTNNVPLLYDSHSFENAIGLEGEIVND